MYEGKTDHTWDCMGMIQYALANVLGGAADIDPIQFHPVWIMNQAKRRKRDPNLDKMDPTESIKMLAAVFMKTPLPG